MIPVDTSPALGHILVCVNERRDSELPSCGDGRSEEVYEAFRRWLTAHRLLTRIWLTQTSCLGWCHEEGTTVAIYPEGAWYRAVTPEDCQQLIERHLHPLIADGKGLK